MINFQKVAGKISFPFIRQANMMECGTTSLAIIFKYYGLANFRYILNQLAEISREGTSLYVLDQIAVNFGFESDGYQLDFDNLSKIKLPCIAHYNGNHFVVIYKKGNDFVRISDPAVGKLKLSKKEFEKKWNGIVLEIKPTNEILKNKDVIEYIEKKKKERKNAIRFFYNSIFSGIKKTLFQIITASIILQIIGLSFPFFTQIIIDKVLPHQNSKLLLIILLALLIVFVTQILITYVRNILLAQFKIKTEFEFFSKFFTHFIKLQQKYFDSTHREDLINRFKENLKLRQILSPGIFQRIIEIPLLIGYLFILFLYNVNLGFITLSFIVVYVIVIYFVTPRLIYYANKIFNENGKIIGQFLESILGINSVKLLGAEFSQTWKFKNRYRNNLNRVLESEKYLTGVGTLLKGLTFIGQTGIYWVGAFYAFKGEMTIGQYIAFITIFGIMLNQINGMTMLWFMFTDLSVTILRFNDIMSQKNETFNIIDKNKNFPNFDIKYENISFSYNLRNKEYVLKKNNIEIKHGEFVGIVGKNGSGKSTFVKLLANLYQNYEGNIYVGNKNIIDYDLYEYRKKIFMLPQEVDLFNDTILENIRFGMPEANTEDVIKASKLADFHDFVKSLYLGYNYKVGDVGGKLSGGQKMKIAFARLFLRNPEIIILDEASSSLDTETEHIIMNNVLSHFKGKTIISIAHRFTTLRNADKIIVFDKGEIVETGNHQELSYKEGHYYNLIRNYINF